MSSKSWADPPPPFPFPALEIPDCASVEEAQTLAKQIIDRGKELFSNKCYLDALWKYHNAYQLCCAKCVSSNIKGKALLGCATSSFELLKQYSSSHERNLFGKYTDSCLSECIDSALPLKFRSKACYTRAQIWKYSMDQPMDKKYRELDDYIQCFKLAFPRQLHLAAEALKQFIVLGVNIKCLESLPIAKELSKQCCSHPNLLVKLLEKLGSSDDTQMKHIEFVLIKSGMTENCKCELPEDTFCRLVSKNPCDNIIQVLFELCSPNEEFVVQLAVKSLQMTEQLLLIQYIIKESKWSDKMIHSICSECNPSQRTQLVAWTIEHHQTQSRTMTILESGEILSEVIDLSKIVEEPTDPTLIQQLLDHNVDPNGNGASRKKPLFIVANKVHRPAKRSVNQIPKLDEIICLLLEAGADIEDLCSLEQGRQTSSLHMATELALRTNNIRILKIVAQKVIIPDDGKVLNYNNETPLHFVLKKPISDITCEACEILVQAGINTECEDVKHKKAADYCKSNDERLELLLMPASPKLKQHVPHQTNTVISSIKIGESTKPLMPENSQVQIGIEEQLEKQVKEVLDLDPEAQSPTGPTPYIESMNYSDNIDSASTDYYRDDTEDNSIDTREWEVEITTNAKNALESPDFSVIRRKAVEKICCLASGERNADLVEKVADNLYECRVNKDVRILWQLSKQESQDHPDLYTDIIRILDIFHHKNLQQRIKHYKRSNAVKCMETYLVVADEDDGKDGYNYPRLFKKSQQRTDHSFKPPVTAPGGDNFQFDHLYPVDKKYMDWLLSGRLKYDVPFKVSSEERKIICREHTSTILLMGRSGTGKTTCCMFRLWHIFKMIWRKWLLEQNTALSKASSLVGYLSTTNPDLQQPSYTLLPPKYRHIFVTKNPRLCEQVKEQFHSLARTGVPQYCSELHLIGMQEHPLPNSCLKMSPFNYPLFLTATQLQILIYNSLFPPESNNAFFPRKEDGSLKVRVLNPEKQDEYVLLPKKDNWKNLHELEDNYRIEVTSTYFKKYIWPKLISPDSPLRKIDPLLIWTEIISFIKGSQEALETDNGWLSEEQYETDIGGKRAPVFRHCRTEVYKLFEKYCKYMNERKPVLFDQADLVRCIYKQLCCTEHPMQLFDHLYVDEIQDFTLAELSLYLKLCNSTEGNFFTGDTAQSIVRGVSFRFADLKVHLHSLGLTCSLDHLTENYRSTYEISQLASSVIDVLKHLFPDSFDSQLPRDVGQIYGNKPLFRQLASPDVNRLASLVEGRNETSNSGVIVHFGADQAIIVCNEDTKAEFRRNKSYDDALVLTVIEAKGLEFNDVILYNFFADSQAKPSDWRIVTSVLEERKMDHIHEKHLALNFELKYLYTAITRAKCNLWICESNKEKSDPMVRLWHKRDLIERLELSTAFSKQSTPEQWLKQGNLLRAAQHWDNAAVCFRKANRLDLSEEMRAQQLLEENRENSSKDQQRQLHLQAASAFLSSLLINPDQEQFDVKVHNAAECLANGRKHQLAAMLFKRLQMTERAIKEFEKAGDVMNCINLMEEKSDHDGAIHVCIKLNEPCRALSLAEKYGIGRIKTAYRCAEYYSERKNIKSLKMIIAEIPQDDQPIYLKQAGLYSDAYDSYVQSKQYKKAFRLIAAQGWYDEGMKLAKSIKDKRREQLCILQKARCKYKQEQLKTAQTAQDQLKTMDDEFPELRAEAHLILGMSDCNHASCEAAIEMYNQCGSLVGEIEAFHVLSQKWKQDDFKLPDYLGTLRVVYDYCEKAKSIEDEAKRDDSGPIVEQCEQFYCLEARPDESNRYYLPNEQDIYVGTLKHCQQARDVDGMLILGKHEVLKEISKHFRQYINDFIDIEFHLVHCVLMQNTSFYTELSRKHIPKESDPGCAEKLLEYLEMCILCHQFTKFQPTKPDMIPTSQEFCSIIIFLFSAEVSIHLPINESHVRVITSSRWACNALCKWGNKLIADLTDPEKQHVNKWMEVWLSFSLSKQNRSDLEEVLHKRASQITDTSSKKSKYPYYYRKQEKDFVHYMTFWITACEKVKKKRLLPAADLVFKCFLAKVSRSPSLHGFESIATIVNIGSVFSTALLGVVASYSALQGGEKCSSVVVPLMYQHIIQVFELLASDIGNMEVGWVLAASVIRSQNKSKQQELVRDSINTLNYFLCLLLGMVSNSQSMSILELATSEPSESNFAGRHCLALVLTLICNLVLNSKQHSSVTLPALIKLRQILGSDQVKSHGFFQKAFETINAAEDVQTFFHLVADLLGGLSNAHHTKSAFVEIHFESGKLVFRELKHDHIPCLHITPLAMLDQQIKSPKRDPNDSTSRYPVSQKHHPDNISIERPATSPPKSPSKSFSSDQRNFGIVNSTKLHVNSAAAFPVQAHTSENTVTAAQTIEMTQAETRTPMHPTAHAWMEVVSNHNDPATQHVQSVQSTKQVKVETKRSSSDPGNTTSQADVDDVHSAPPYLTAIGHAQPHSTIQERPSTEHLPKVIATSEASKKAKETKPGNQNASKNQLSPTQTTAQAETGTPIHPKVDAVSNHNDPSTQHVQSVRPTKQVKVETKRSSSEPGNTTSQTNVDGVRIAPAYSTVVSHTQPQHFSIREKPTTRLPPIVIATSESNRKAKPGNHKDQLSPTESLKHTQTTTSAPKLVEKSFEQALLKSTENDPQSCSSSTLGNKVRKNDSGNTNNSIPSALSASENSATKVTQTTAQSEAKTPMHPKVHTQVAAASNHTQNLHSVQPTKQMKVETKRSFSEPGNTAGYSDVGGMHSAPTANAHSQPQSVSIQERLSAEHLPNVIATSESNSTPEQALKSTGNDPLSLRTSPPSAEKKQNGSGNTNNRTRNQQPSEEPLSLPAQNVVKEDERTELQLGMHSAETMPMHSETFTNGVSPSVVVSSSETLGLNHTGIRGTSSAPTTQQSAPSQPQPHLPTLESAPQLTSKSQLANKQQQPEYNQAHQSSDFSRKSQPRPPMQPLSGATYMQAPWPQQPLPFAQLPHTLQSLEPTTQLTSTPHFGQAYQPRETLPMSPVHPLSGATNMQGQWYQQPQQPYPLVGPALHPHHHNVQYPNIMPQPTAVYPFPQPIQPFPFLPPEYMTAQFQHGMIPLPLPAFPAIPMTYTEAGQLPPGHQWYPMPVFANLFPTDQGVDLPESEISELLTRDPAT